MQSQDSEVKDCDSQTTDIDHIQYRPYRLTPQTLQLSSKSVKILRWFRKENTKWLDKALSYICLNFLSFRHWLLLGSNLIHSLRRCNHHSWKFSNTMEWKKVSIFLAWAVFTFCSHYSAKQFLSSSEHLTKNVILLTSLQMAAGSVLFLKLTISGGVGVRIKFSSHLRPQTITVQVSIRKVNILF